MATDVPEGSPGELRSPRRVAASDASVVAAPYPRRKGDKRNEGGEENVQTIPRSAAEAALTLTSICAEADRAVREQNYRRLGDAMLYGLDQYRRQVSSGHWKDVAIPYLRQQNFYAVAQEDPFSRRSTLKPRGYAGDALLLDFLYKEDLIGEELVNCSPAGQALCNYWTNSPAARAVRNRRTYLSRQLIRTIRRNPGARILVLAAGHFREGEILMDTGALSVASVTCLDQDPESCAVVAQRYAGVVDVQNKSISHALRLKAGPYDLIYAAGLYDYLSEEFARKLNRQLTELLVRGGRLIVPNFLRSAPNRASMELLQDWSLIYRDRVEIIDLLPKLDRDAHDLHYFEDTYHSVGYAVLDLK